VEAEEERGITMNDLIQAAIAQKAEMKRNNAGAFRSMFQ